MKAKSLFKKLLFISCFLLLIFTFAGCGNNNSKESNSSNVSNSENKESEQNTKKTNLSLVGEWKSEDGKVPGQEATITEDKIEIRWINSKENLESLNIKDIKDIKDSKVLIVDGDTYKEDDLKQKLVYWVGTYTAPKASEDKYSWTSKGDKEKVKDNLLPAQEETKDFKYENGVLSYKITVSGKTIEMKLKKV